MNNTAKLGAILPALLNPATAVIGVGLGLLWLLSGDDEEADAQADVATAGAALTDGSEVAGTNVSEPSPTVVDRQGAITPETYETAPAAISAAEKKEMIRKTMSELGKRSAAARAKKKRGCWNKLE